MKRINLLLVILSMSSTLFAASVITQTDDLTLAEGSSESDFNISYGFGPRTLRNNGFGGLGFDLVDPWKPSLNSGPKNSLLLGGGASYFSTSFDSTGNCGSSYPNNFFLSTYEFSNNILGISASLGCSVAQHTTEKRFSKNYCELLGRCAESLAPNLYAGKYFISDYVAEDYMRVSLDRNLIQMEQLERIKKFSEKKYGKEFASKCESPFLLNHVESEDQCNLKLLNDGFKYQQSKCSLVQLACYKSTDSKKNFELYKKQHIPEKRSGLSEVDSFFIDKNNDEVDQALSYDAEVLEALGAVLKSNDPGAEKIKNYFKVLRELSKAGKLDPVFAFDDKAVDANENVYKNSWTYKFLERELGENKPSPLVTNPILVLEELRKKFAEKILNQMCKPTTTLRQICYDATQLKKGLSLGLKNNKVDVFDSISANDKDRYEDFKAIFPDIFKKEEEFRIFLEAQRCKAYGFIDPTKPLNQEGFSPFSKPDGKSYTQTAFGGSYFTPGISLSPGFGGEGLFTQTFASSSGGKGSSYYFSKETLFDDKEITKIVKSISSQSSGFDYADYDQFQSPKKTIESTPITSNSVTVNPDGRMTSEIEELNRQTSEVSQGAQNGLAVNAPLLPSSHFSTASPSRFDSQHQDSDDEKKDDQLAEVSGIDAQQAQTPTVSTLLEKIETLEKKLGESQDKMEKLKKLKEEEEKERARQKAIEEENKTIAELRSQIEELKTENTKIAAAKQLPAKKMEAESFEPAVSSSYGTALGSSSRSAEAATRQERPDSQPQNSGYEQNYNSSPNPSSASSGSVTSASSARTIFATPSATTSSGNIASTGSRSSIVLTKVDGLSSERVVDTIYQKIKENNGTPFFIEEGGFIKEIIPVTKDGNLVLDEKGNPTYEKVVKGKTSDPKFNAKAPANSAPIQSKADLLKDQEEKLKRERAEYMKLKQLIKDVVPAK